MLTEVLISLELIKIPSILRYGLSSVEGACVTCGACKCIRLREETLASLKVLKTKALDIGCKELRLAEPVVCMAVESPDKTTVVVIPCLITQWTIGKSGPESTPDIIPQGKVGPKHVEEF